MIDEPIDNAGMPAARGLFVTDAELIRRLGVGEKTARVAISELERRSGFPKKDKLFGDKRYWPAVVHFFNLRYGLTMARARPLVADGNERWPKGNGKVEIRAPDGTTWLEDAKPTDPKSWQKKRELKPRAPSD